MSDASLEAAGEGRFTIRGRLSFASTPALYEQGRRLLAGGDGLTFDLVAVNHADSAGLALLIAWTREARRQGRDIHFLNVPQQLRAIARVSGLEAILPLA